MSTDATSTATSRRRTQRTCTSRRPRRAQTIPKEQWIQRHTDHMLRLWLRWQTPLGVASDYARQLEKDLARFYEQPLTRMFIESTF
jgi:hypothetical protein